MTDAPQLAKSQIRSLTADDLPEAQAISSSFGWAHRLEDWQSMFELGRGYAATGEDNKLAGAAMCWMYGDSFATIGLVVVAKDQQKRGIGRRLMEAVLGDAENRTSLLYASKQGEPLYRSLGFEAIGAIHKHEGYADLNRLEPVAGSGTIKTATKNDLDMLNQMDHAVSGLPRRRLIEALFRAGEGLILNRNGSPAGYSFRRPFGRGSLIGPVVAENTGDALTLINAHVQNAGKTFVRIDIPPQYAEIANWLEQAQLPAISSVTTMANGPRPKSGPNTRMYAIASQALG